MENGILHKVSHQVLIRGQGLTKQQSMWVLWWAICHWSKFLAPPNSFHTHIHVSSEIHWLHVQYIETKIKYSQKVLFCIPHMYDIHTFRITMIYQGLFAFVWQY